MKQWIRLPFGLKLKKILIVDYSSSENRRIHLRHNNPGKGE